MKPAGGAFVSRGYWSR